MYKQDLTLNNLQGLICHKTKPNQSYRITKSAGIIQLNLYKGWLISRPPSLSLSLSIYIYIYRERERQTDRQTRLLYMTNLFPICIFSSYI